MYKQEIFRVDTNQLLITVSFVEVDYPSYQSNFAYERQRRLALPTTTSSPRGGEPSRAALLVIFTLFSETTMPVIRPSFPPLIYSLLWCDGVKWLQTRPRDLRANRYAF